MIWVLFLLQNGGASFFVHAAENSQAPPVNALEHFIQLNQSLPQAVCDEDLISKPPSLSMGSLENAGAGAIPKLFRFEVALQEREIIQFLMESPRTLVAATGIRSRASALNADQWPGLKRKISLEFCTALVTPGKINELLSRNADWFFTLEEWSEFSLQSKGKRKISSSNRALASILFQDVEARVGKSSDHWRLAGWIEPRESVSVEIRSREYRRFFNPITNQTQFVEILGPDEVPLAYFYPSLKREAESFTWEALRAQEKSEENLRKKIQSYHLMLEFHAYHALNRFPQKSDSIRKLQDFYKNLINAYQIYPESDQFTAYGKKTAVFDPRKILDESFFSELKESVKSGLPVSIGLLEFDPKLHAIYREYRLKLEKI